MTTDGILLVADGDSESVKRLLGVVKRRGIEGEVASSGREALERMEATPPRVLVLDELMPDMSGLDVFRLMRARPERPDVRVIFYTASYDWEKQRDAQLMGARAWMVKGVNGMDELLATIEKYMRS